MFEKTRARLALAILPHSKAATPISTTIMSTLPANIPIYTDMTVYKATREGYKVSVYVYRAVRTIIQAASAIPWIVVDSRTDEPIENHQLERLMKRPNSVFSGQDMIEFLIAHLELVGNALWQPIIVGHEIREIWPIMPDLVRPIPSKDVGEWLKGWDVIGSDGRHETLPPDRFWQFMQMDPGNPYWGMAPLMAAARTIDTDNEAQDTQKISMQNRGVMDGVFTHDAIMNQEQFDEARRQIREKYLDKNRRREPWVLGAGAKWQQMSMTPIEMDYIASRLANLRAIAAAYGIDPWWLGDRTTSTYNNVSEARKALYEDVVIPLLDDVESTLNIKIQSVYGEKIKLTYDLSGVPSLREDFGKKVTQAKSLWDMGVPFEQINTRLEMGFEEFPGWDSGYLSAGLLPTGSAENSTEAQGGQEEVPADDEVQEAIEGGKAFNLVRQVGTHRSLISHKGGEASVPFDMGSQSSKANPNHGEDGRFAEGGGAGGGVVGYRPLGRSDPEDMYRPLVDYRQISQTFGEKLIIEGDAKASIIATHLNDIAQMDTETLQTISDKGFKVYIGDAPITGLNNNQALKGVVPRGWVGGQTWDVCAGGMSKATSEVFLGSGQHGGNSLALHEMGHAVDMTYDVAHNPTFIGMRDQAIGHGLMRDPYFRQPGYAGLEETFAGLHDRAISDPVASEIEFGKDLTMWARRAGWKTK